MLNKMPETPEEAAQVLKDRAKFKSLFEYAKALGIPESTANGRHKKAKLLAAEQPEKQESVVEHVELQPEFNPQDHIESMIKRFQVRKSNKDLTHWMPVKIKNNKISIVPFIGDPHLDDDGTNWPMLVHHMEIMAQLQKSGHNCFPVCMGDIVNNWVKSGRLVKKWADQNTTQSQSYKLAKYFLHDMGVKFCLYILGNHDKWNEFIFLLEEYCQYVDLPMQDWRCRFKFVFENGYEVKIDAAHDHKGNSMYNKTHAQDRAVLFAGMKPDIILSAHRHTYSLKHDFEPDVGFIWKGRMSGYKVIDEYAEFLQYDNQNVGHSIWAVIDPIEKNTECFDSPEKALVYYNGLMVKYGEKVFG
jgi:hypothetical protein